MRTWRTSSCRISTRGQILLAAPGHTVLLIPNLLRQHGRGDIAFCDTATLPYIVRKSGPASMRVTQAARYLVFAAFPAQRTAELADLIRPVYPTIQPGANLLETVFPYTNAIHHPPATLCNVGRIEATKGDYYHYYDGISPSVGRLIDALDRERLAIAAALNVHAFRFVEQFYRNGYTTEAARDSGLAYEAFHQSEPDRWIRRAGDASTIASSTRIFRSGSCRCRSSDTLPAVPTPTIDRMIHLACVTTGKDFRAQGLTLERLGLAGIDAASAIRLLDRGYPDTRHCH